MGYYKHGVSIGLLQINSEFVLSVKAVGTLTHEDYQHLVPMLEAAINKIDEPQVKVLFDATEFAGWEMRAAWDDLRLAVKYGSGDKKVAVYGNHDWVGWTMRVGQWFMAEGEVESFDTYEQAVDWLCEPEMAL